MPQKGQILPFEEFLKKCPEGIYVYPDSYTGMRNKVKIRHPEYGDLITHPSNLIKRKFSYRPRLKTDKNGFLTEEAINSKLLYGAKIKYDTYVSKKRPAVFVDPEYGEFTAVVSRAMSGAKHPKRRRSKPVIAAEEVQNRLPNYLTLDKSTYKTMHRKARFIDSEYGEWWALPYNVLWNKTEHPSKYANKSKDEESVAMFLTKHLGVKIERSSRTLKKGKNGPEIDIFIPSHNLGIEYNGLYWHSELKLSSTYHLKKRKAAESQNILLLQIYADEWLFKRNIVKSIIRSKLGILNTKYQARKLIIKEVGGSQAQEFLIENHLMGEYKTAKYLGLYTKDNELVSLLGYKKHKDGIDISRFCNKLDTAVVGGLSKLLKEVERLNPEVKYIQSWVDLRYGTGNSLLKLGFKHVKTTLGWKWTDGISTYNRLRCRANMDKRKLTEREYANELGWYRIYDAGQALFVNGSFSDFI